MYRFRLSLVVAALTVGVLQAHPGAHHAFAEFDVKKTIVVTGTVTRLAWINPHAHIYIDVKDDAGSTTPWDFELGSPNALIRRGWTDRTLKPGDVITVRGYRAKDGSRFASAREVMLSDGRTVFAGSAAGDR